MEGIKIGFTREVAYGGDGSQNIDRTGHAMMEERAFYTQRISSTNKSGNENIQPVQVFKKKLQRA